jgi:hypothetical protein
MTAYTIVTLSSMLFFPFIKKRLLNRFFEQVRLLFCIKFETYGFGFKIYIQYEETSFTATYGCSWCFPNYENFRYGKIITPHQSMKRFYRQLV